jgi:hypothetical protein
MNRRDIVVCLLCSVVLLGRSVQAQQTGKAYYIAVIGPNAQPSDQSEASHDQAQARLFGAFFGAHTQMRDDTSQQLLVEVADIRDRRALLDADEIHETHETLDKVPHRQDEIGAAGRDGASRHGLSRYRQG